ncbi:AsmA family protein [Methylobrevis pamukkalensis]|uniref:AsmA family protein n=1 Tax=Methylobrevis pamukkalensis TaxID=1439726 RepID=A0A1E3H310_9HYPH|nr:AsmA-like C-terminal region-containing protein [Methylobrevis pamukkalensis]ODN70717.1 AsmA family protein [Methylobrevis pamukkalensis]
MRQLGFDVDDGGTPGAGQVTLKAGGVPERALTVAADATLGGTSTSIEGTIALPAVAPVTADLAVRLGSDDIGPVLALAGPRLASLTMSLPLDLSARVTAAGNRISATDIAGSFAGTPTAGALSLDLAPARPAVGGELSFGELEAAGLAEIALGAGTLEPPIDAATPWPEIPFGASIADGLDGDVAVRVRRVGIAEGLDLDDVTLHLRSSSNAFAVDDISGVFAGGRATGSLVIKRGGNGTADIALRAQVAGAALDDIVWQRAGRPVATGRFDLDLDVEGVGRSLAGVISGLGGGGSFRATDGVLRSFNPAAFGAVIRAADAGLDLNDAEIARAFTSHVDAGDLVFAGIEGSFSLAGGTLRAPRLEVSGSRAETVGSAVVDLTRGTLSSDWSLSIDPGADAVTGAQPQVGILFRGQATAPERTIDVTAFTAYLTLRAFEREVRRVEAMQSDILERETFARQVKRIRQDREQALRDAEAARIAAERAAAERAAEERAALERAEAERAEAERAAAEQAAEEERAAAERAAQERAAEEERARQPAEMDLLPGVSPEVQQFAPQTGGPGTDTAPPAEDDFGDLIRQKLEQLPLEPLPPPIDVGPSPGGG